MLLEVCVDNIQSVENAIKGGASRIELCSALSEGGLTPSAGMTRRAVQMCHKANVEVRAMIRPRRGDFLYTPAEIDIMRNDISEMIDCGVDGVVFGCLNIDGDVDIDNALLLINRADEVDITFHRAFDLCKNPDDALIDLIDLGFDTLLTSGLAENAVAGSGMLRHLVESGDNQIEIMAGGGVTPDNVRQIAEATGVNALHGSFRSLQKSGMEFRRNDVEMGAESDEYSLLVADTGKIRRAADLIKQF